MSKNAYEKAVKETAEALAGSERADWLAAKNTYEHTHRGRPRNGGQTVTMEQWCADVQAVSSVRLRFGPSTGSRYARIWAKHGLESSSPAVNFKEAYAEVDGTPDRGRMMEYEGTRLLEKGTPDQKIEQANALLRDPAVREAARSIDTPLGGVVYGVSLEQKEHTTRENTERVRAAEERFKNDPTDVAIRNARAITDLTAILSDFARDVAQALPKITSLPEQDRDAMNARLFLREAQARAKGAVEQVDDLLTTGKVGGGADAFLKSILGGDEGK